MNVKCPYCGCCYNIGDDLLKNPIGSPLLGYGWWLRCYKCHKKFWLKNIEVARQIDTPLTADRQSKIDKISALTRNTRKPIREKKSGKFFKYFLILLLISFSALCYHNKDIISNFIISKAKRLSRSVANKLQLMDVRYSIDNENKITISGIVKNEDRSVINVQGVRISAKGPDGKILKSWDENLKSNTLIPGDTINFSSSNQLDSTNNNDIKVEVAIY